MNWHIINWFVLAGYLCFLVWLGFFFSKKNKTGDDYFVGGRRIPAWAAALSLYATALSSISFVAITSNVYRTGWVFAAGVLAIIPLLFFIAKFFVPFIRRLNATTAYQYLEARFDRPMRLMASIVFMSFHIMRIAIVIFIPTLALREALPQVNPIVLVAVMGFLCVIYTSVGGFEAVIWADVIQTFILFGSAFLIIVIGFMTVPAGTNAFAVLTADNKIFSAETFSFDPKATTFWGLFIGSFFGTIYQYIGSQDITQRYSATKSLAESRKTVLMNVPLLLVSVVMFLGMGSAIYLFYKYSGVPAPELENHNAILPFFVINQIPLGISGLIIAGVFAAAQSTVSSSLNSTATCAVVDFIAPMKPNITENEKVLYAKIASWTAGIAGTLMAMNFVISGQGDMYLLFNGVMGLMGGPISGIFLLGIFSNKVSSKGAWLSFWISFAVSIYFGNPANILSAVPGYIQPKIFPFLFAPICIASCMIPGYITTLFMAAPAPEKTKGLTMSYLKDTSDIV